MLEIASQAEVDTRSVIQYIIGGIQDDPVNKTVLHEAKTIRELKERFVQYEAIRKEGKSRVKQSKLEEKRKTFRSDVSSTEKRRCFNCGDKDHVGKACPIKDKGAKCFKCNQDGHIVRACTSTASTPKESVCTITKSLQQKQLKQVKINNQCFVTVIDTVSDLSLINQDSYKKIGRPKLDNKIRFDGLSALNTCTYGSFAVSVDIDSEIYEITFHVVDDGIIKHAILIGADFLNFVELHSVGGRVTIRKIPEESINMNNLNILEVLKVNVVKAADPFDFSYIPYQEIRQEIESIARN